MGVRTAHLGQIGFSQRGAGLKGAATDLMSTMRTARRMAIAEREYRVIALNLFSIPGEFFGLPVRSTVPPPGPSSGLITLHTLDPVTHSMSFGDGTHGGVIQDHEVRNVASDIELGNYFEGEFSVGIEGGRLGSIIDLGTGDDLSERYRYEETVGGGQGFASIRFVDDELVILDDDGLRTVQPLAEAAALFDAQTSGAHARVHLGHVYLVRLTDRHDAAFERVAKLLVVAHRPGESVTFRWVRLR